mgnify:FL=1
MTFIRYIFVLCVLFATLCGCVRQSANNARVEVLLQGQLEQPESDANIHPAVYVNVRATTNQLFGVRAQTEAWLQRQGFTVVPNPSEAGYILQVVVLSAGIAAPESVRQMVAAGYDTPSQLSGRGSTALVADVLLVQRHVPSAQQPSRSKLKSISKRNAVASSQMRIGLLALQEFKGDGVPPVFAETLGKELAAHIHGAAGQDVPTQPTSTP